MHDTHPALDAILADLNEPQREAVLHRDGPLLVLAGPGSGKTRVITRRAAMLVHTGVPAHHILAITFTNKAAGEMKRRIEALGVAGGMWIHTFHALGVRLLREFGPLAEVEPGFVIYDEADQLRVVKEAMELCKTRPDADRPERIQSIVSDAKNRLLRPADFWNEAESIDYRVAAGVYETYESLLRARNAVDFDDLLMRVALLLRAHADIAERLNRRFRYVLIDEYQDTNRAQYVIAHALTQHHHNLCATGDPDQSIYAWRGADIGNILDFERDYPDAKVVRLEQNYRSTASVLRAAASLIAANHRRKPKELWTQRPAGGPVQVWQFATGDQEAEQVAETIAQRRAEGRAYNDFAIFYRINALSRRLEEALRARGIPYQIARGVEFYNRKEIKDTLAYLRVLVNPADPVALLRIINTPARGIGDRTIERLVAAARESGRPLLDLLHSVRELPALRAAAGRVAGFVALLDELKERVRGSVAQAISDVLQISGLEAELKQEAEGGGEDRLANVQELVSAAKRYEQETEAPSLEDFLQRVALVSDQDAVDESAGVVMLMTLHAAKGLEFPVVFLVGLEQGLLPHERALRAPDPGRAALEEERRLCFVGLTRAMEELYLCHANERLLRGSRVPQVPSMFLRELGREATNITRFDGDDRTPGVPARGPAAGRRTRSAAAAGPRRGRRASALDGEPVYTMDDPTRQALLADAAPQFADWTPGTRVEHSQYGVGQVLWIRPGGAGQTRASICFSDEGEKTFILELAPIRRLQPRDR